mmetsp:Transcript_11480/g.42013  ORF Transcript_11480/g.42013 Transcript_11480/m.42013 type:complete len:230 (+) Transcript_11480:1-690(+)
MDGSHDWWHIHRVRNLAMKLATMEGIEDEATRETIEMAALLHDVKDWKYSGSDSAGVEAVEVFLRSLEYPAEKRESILFVISNLGFKEELSNKAKPAVTPELAIVQDADRIDAIGAIGIARCFTFGGSKNQVLHDPGLMPRQGLTKESYMKEKGTTINHFHEKLLLLKDKLKTKSGRWAIYSLTEASCDYPEYGAHPSVGFACREVASRRHDFMEEYVARFYQEWDATD